MPKINKNFLVVSNYNNNIEWITEYTEDYVVYDRSDSIKIPDTIDKNKIIKTSNIGYNFYDYFTFIIDNYERLPENIIFAKGNIFPRHIQKEYFEKIVNNEYYTPIVQPDMHTPQLPAAFFLSDGGYCEINNSWYLKHYKTKYFTNYNDFLKFIYKNPIIPKYIRFAPGGNYIVPKSQILKLPKVVYQNLKLFISHCSLAGETHIIERAMHTLWNSDFELSNEIQEPLDQNFSLIPKDYIKNIKHRIIYEINHIIQKIKCKI